MNIDEALQGAAASDENFSSLDSAEDMPEAGDIASASAPDPVITAKIQKIEIRFTRAVRDIKGRIMPHGKATATFTDGKAIIVTVTGGANVKTYGITDPVRNLAVTRKEGVNYLNYQGAPMPYAVFYNRGEALHVGRLDVISHGCVHVADVDRMRRINLACVIGKTRVTVIYEPGILTKVMKQRL